MGNYFNSRTLFDTIVAKEKVRFPTYSNESGHIIMGGIIEGCTFTVIADVGQAVSLSISGPEKWPSVLARLREIFTSVIGTEPLCQFDVHSESELHVNEWCLDTEHTDEYLYELINGGGRYFYLKPKDNIALANGHDPAEYYSEEYATALIAAYQQQCHENWCRLNSINDTAPKVGQPYVGELALM